MKDIEIVRYSPDLIDASPYQVRKRFDETALKELVTSVIEHGIIQPLTARVSPKDPARLELVAGERRLRAGKMAGLETVPVIVHELSDRAAQEIVLIENLQREDLTVSEEAQGYQAALDLRDDEGKPVYTQQSLAQKIGKKLNHVRDRLKLLLCPKELIESVETGEVSISTAMLVGRIPDTQARKDAAKRVMSGNDTQEVPLNFKQTEEMIKETFMVSLQKPGFDPEDADLLPVVTKDGVRVMGGSCADCPFRSGNCQEDRALNSALGTEQKHGGKIVAGGTTADNLCTLPSCHKKKQDAAWKIVRQHAEAQNVRVVEGDAARQIFRGHGGGLSWDSPYVQLDDKPSWSDVGEDYHKNKKTWGALLKGTDVETVIARHPVTGKRVELAEKKPATVVAKAKLKGKDVAAEFTSTSDAEAARKEERKKELREQKIEKHTLFEALSDLAEAIGRKGMDLDNLDYLFQNTLSNSGADGFKIVKDWLELQMPKGTASSSRDYEDDILKTVREKVTTPQQWLGFIVVATLAKSLRWSGFDDEDLQEYLKRYNIKPQDLERRATAIVDAGKKPAKKPESGPSVTELITGVQDSKQGRPNFAAGPREVAGVFKTEADIPTGEHFCYCDGCHKVCDVTAFAERVWAMPAGEFRCSHCGDYTRFRILLDGAEVDRLFLPLEAKQAAEFEDWNAEPAAPSIMRKARDWKAKNPNKGSGTMAAELDIDIELALKISDFLIDEKYDGKIVKPEATTPKPAVKKAAKKPAKKAA